MCQSNPVKAVTNAVSSVVNTAVNTVTSLPDLVDPMKGMDWMRSRMTPGMPASPAAQMIAPSKRTAPGVLKRAGTDTAEADRAATAEAMLRRRRAGAAANVLTSPLGIPAGSNPTLGGGA